MWSKPVPIALLVDDSCPLVHVYRFHWEAVHHQQPVTKDGRVLQDYIPNSFLKDFCDVCEHWGIRGKFSIVPAPAGLGDIVQGIRGFPPGETVAWLERVKKHLSPLFDFTPEGITHNLTLDLSTGNMLPIGESDWSQTQNRETLTPYLVYQLELLKKAGIDANGFTSPWVFGIKVEREYILAMIEAQRRVYRRNFSWYFLHMIYDQPSLRPWVAYRDERACLVSIPATVPDLWWQTIDDPTVNPREIAKSLYQRCRKIAGEGGIPVVLTHWQSLFSNGLAIGLEALEELGRLVSQDSGLEWTRCSELARATAIASPS